MNMTDATRFWRLNYFVSSVFIALVVMCCGAHADDGLPKGTLGWWSYTAGVFTRDLYLSDPVAACQRTAKNHAGQPLVGMEPYPGRRDMFRCFYRLFAGGSVSWNGNAHLECEQGYKTYEQGVCRKEGQEVPVPLKCGEAAGNPVQFASGAKVQTEIDLVGGLDNSLRVERTYRSVHENALGQSAGVGWSFSFERAFSAPRTHGSIRAFVRGASRDGSFFQFIRLGNGTYESTYDRGMTLEVQGPDDAVWLVTTPDGTVERFIRIGDDFRLSSVHKRNGMATYYTYDPKNQLAMITDHSGRELSITWGSGVIVAIAHATGSVRYEYEQATIPGYGTVEGTSQLIGVHFLDRTGAVISSRAYHYEDGRNRYLLTGITDEHGKRFATYAYNGDAQAVLSEHAGGAGRYTFAYPSRNSRIVTDPLGSGRRLDIEYGADGKGRIVAESQPGGAGCAASASASAYSEQGDVKSRTDFNGNMTCFFGDTVRGTELARITGLEKAATCPARVDSILPPSARKTSLRWHPDWPLTTGIAAPMRLETTLYNGQRDAAGKVVECAGGALLPNGKPIAVICRATVQSTSDSSGTLGF